MRSTTKIGAKISPSLFGFFFFGVYLFFLVLHVVPVICIKPNLLEAEDFVLCFVAFHLRASVRRGFLWSGFGMSIKSTTIIPPMSRSLSCLQFL